MAASTTPAWTAQYVSTAISTGYLPRQTGYEYLIPSLSATSPAPWGNYVYQAPPVVYQVQQDIQFAAELNQYGLQQISQGLQGALQGNQMLRAQLDAQQLHWPDAQTAYLQAVYARQDAALAPPPQEGPLPRIRARKLLSEHLNEAQRATFERHGWFEVAGHHTGHVYRLHRRWTGSIEAVVDGHRMGYCIHPHETMPIEDSLLSQKLLIEYDEEHFLVTANAWQEGDGRLDAFR